MKAVTDSGPLVHLAAVWLIGYIRGPGYRVYYGRAGDRIVLLLCGGTKEAQSRDIEQARTYWRDYRSRSS